MRTRTRSPFRQPPNTQEAYKKLSKDIWNPTDRPVFSDSRCLVFGRCGCGVKNSNERSRPPLSGECRLKRLVAGVSGYICDQCVTKCVAVLEQNADPRNPREMGHSSELAAAFRIIAPIRDQAPTQRVERYLAGLV